MEELRLNEETLLRGVRLLTEQDQDLCEVVSRFGPPPLWARAEGFQTLIHIILEQQVSLASARAALEKLLVKVSPLNPASFLTLSDDELKRVGFSRQKTSYGRNLARAFLEGGLDPDSLATMDDDDVKKQLVKIKGIGSWTADIYLLMALGRPDIWPRGDLALETAYQRLKRMATRPTPDELQEISLAWSPWRAVAARILWHFYLSERRAGLELKKDDDFGEDLLF